ncbi:hypothetical protein TNCV_767651 [Trichonephila clavipes]|nr:hypothetical protein TNCV_767651 [Trichonephila clavipes]
MEDKKIIPLKKEGYSISQIATVKYHVHPGWPLSRLRSTSGSSRQFGVTLFTQLNSVTQQPVRGKATVPISVFVTLGTEVHGQIFQLGGQPNTKPPVFSS